MYNNFTQDNGRVGAGRATWIWESYIKSSLAHLKFLYAVKSLNSAVVILCVKTMAHGP